MPHLRGANDQNRISGEAYHFFGYAPQQPALYARASMRAHGYKVIGRSLAEANDLTGSGTFGYGEGNFFDSVALEFPNFAFEVTLCLVPERDADPLLIDWIVILHSCVSSDRDMVGTEQKDFQL